MDAALWIRGARSGFAHRDATGSTRNEPALAGASELATVPHHTDAAPLETTEILWQR